MTEDRSEREVYYRQEQYRLRCIEDDPSSTDEQVASARQALKNLAKQYAQEMGVITDDIFFTQQEMDKG